MSGVAVGATVAGAAVSGGINAASSGKGKSKAPAAPDPYKTAEAQFQLNKQGSNFDAAQNRFQQYTPSGSIEWVNNGSEDNPAWTQTTKLSPENQRLYDTQLANQQTMGSRAASEMPAFFESLKSKARPIDNTTFNQVAQTQLARMQPGLNQATDMLTTRLANQGLAPGGEAYKMGMLSDAQARNDAYLAAVNSAMDAQSQENSMMNANESQNNANQGQSINNMSALLTGQGTVDIPTFSGNSSVGGISIPDIANMIQQQYSNNNNQSIADNNANTAQKNAISSAGGNLGSSVTSGLANSKQFQNLFGASPQNKYGVISGNFGGL